MLFLNWFTSSSVRNGWQVANHVEKILRHQVDLLSPESSALVAGDIQRLRESCRSGDKAGVAEALGQLEKSANKWLKPYPNAAWRENIEVALVAIAVAVGIRTFFLQPFKIPTGSMQPTLYGVTHEDLRNQPEVAIPNAAAKFLEYWFSGVQYFHVTAKTSGRVAFAPPSKFVLFNLKQNWSIDNQPQPPIWFPPDMLFERGGVFPGTPVQAGQDVLKMRIISGDHLFVDRVTYNFRKPKRGDIVVFETHGISKISENNPELADTYYIKRLCGLGEEKIQLSQDYTVKMPNGAEVPVGHMIVDEKTDITSRISPFEHLYSYPDATSTRERSFSFRENHYIGHAMMQRLSPGASEQIPPRHYFVMGDNTLNSSDSRYWGTFPQEKVIGKSFFVYWPIGGTMFKGEMRQSRFGWSHR